MDLSRARCTLLALAVAMAVAGCKKDAGDAPAPGARTPDAGASAPAADAAVPTAATAGTAPVRDADALAALEKMGAALRALDGFGLEADTSTEYVADDGQKISVDGTVAYRVRMPDRFVVQVANDRQQRDFHYDGKSLVIWSPALKYYTVVGPVPGTIPELVAQAAGQGVEFPLADLFLWGTERAPLDSLTSAYRVGPSKVDGEAVDHYAFRQPGVDWQVWISRATSLPAKLAITSLSDPAQPSYTARLRWDTRGGGTDATFAFDPPAGASRVEFVPAGATAATSAEEQ